MKLATLKDGSRDGRLVVVSRDLSRVCPADAIAPTLQRALDDWEGAAPALAELYERLNRDAAPHAQLFDPRRAMAPLPRAYQWIDGSVYKNHGELMQKAFEVENTLAFREDEPLMYQGGSDDFLGPCDDIVVADEALGVDFEGEVSVVTGDVPMRCPLAAALSHIRLLMLANDVSLRNLIMKELGRGFGFFHSKPATAFSPCAVTPEELGGAWRGALVHLPLRVSFNAAEFGRANAGMGASFNFAQLVAHAASTRNLRAGTIIGSGTVSNADPAAGSSCIAERRAIERIGHGEPRTPLMIFGDRVRIEMLDAQGRSIFGAIDQKVAPLHG
ncbi:MAG: fumarylacetoacetate hydrolase family protein [Burkholderiales bacterium]|nr:fumarylacetoacetate hydrolase family protein [Burkholderiales bacterium]